MAIQVVRGSSRNATTTAITIAHSTGVNTKVMMHARPLIASGLFRDRTRVLPQRGHDAMPEGVTITGFTGWFALVGSGLPSGQSFSSLSICVFASCYAPGRDRRCIHLTFISWERSESDPILSARRRFRQGGRNGAGRDSLHDCTVRATSEKGDRNFLCAAPSHVAPTLAFPRDPWCVLHTRLCRGS